MGPVVFLSMVEDAQTDRDGGAGSAMEPDPIMDRRMTERREAERRQAEQQKAQQQKAQQPSGDASAAAERRTRSDRRQGERRTKGRPARNINQYDMTEDELEFVNAIVRFRGLHDNRFPKARDILQILRDLGYEKRTDG